MLVAVEVAVEERDDVTVSVKATVAVDVDVGVYDNVADGVSV